jgi:4-hydroxybenzoate polyprenyltransferase
MPELPTDRIEAMVPPEESLVGYLLRLSRPRFWLYLGGPVIVGVSYAADGPGELFAPLAIALFLYFTIPANVFLYGVNDIFDADIDELNPKKSEEGKEVRYRGDSAVTATIVAATVLGVAFVPFLPPEGIVALAAFYALGTAYSAPPLRFKTTPLLDSLSNGLYITPGIVAFAAMTGEIPPLLAIGGGWLWTMGMHTFSAIPDIEPDRKAGIQTTATVLGERWTLVYCGVCWLAAAVLMGLIHPFLGNVFVVYPVFVVVLAASPADISRAYWWFPAINFMAGMALTMAAIWRVVYA